MKARFSAVQSFPLRVKRVDLVDLHASSSCLRERAGNVVVQRAR
jgi:hypothetical protein